MQTKFCPYFSPPAVHRLCQSARSGRNSVVKIFIVLSLLWMCWDFYRPHAESLVNIDVISDVFVQCFFAFYSSVRARWCSTVDVYSAWMFANNLPLLTVSLRIHDLHVNNTYTAFRLTSEVERRLKFCVVIQVRGINILQSCCVRRKIRCLLQRDSK